MKKAKKIIPTASFESRPSLGLPDPLLAAQEACRLAQEGSVKLARAVDTLRQTLETIVVAEFDNTTQMPVSARDLRTLAAGGLDAYSLLTGQSWKRHKIVASRAGDRNMAGLAEQGYSDHG